MIEVNMVAELLYIPTYMIPKSLDKYLATYVASDLPHLNNIH